jgi:cytochrome c
MWRLAAILVVLTACHPQDDETARQLTGGNPHAGKVAITRYGCGGCHEIPGVDNAGGLVGPSLAKIGDRMTLAGELPNQPDNMIKWIASPQTAEPGSLMPDMHVTDRDARDIAAYLYTLRADGSVALRSSPDRHAHPIPPPTSAEGPVLASQDRDFIERATEGNNGEIAIGGLVHGRALNAGVVQFGDQLVADHRAANARLGAIARQRAIALPGSLGDHQAVYDQLIDRKGEPFDRKFVTSMVDDHEQAVQLYRGELASGVDPLLRQYAATTLPTIEAHLAHAKSLAALAPPEP